MRKTRQIRIGLGLIGGLAALTSAPDAHAQGAGSAGRPLPDVLLLVDNSGSMERKPDNKLPNCSAGDASSEPNRWGMLLQAMTGNFQPYFSCAAVSRSKSTNPKFATLYGINGKDPYDTDYALPFNMPMTGGTAADACVIAPWKLPGATGSTGVGVNKLTSGGNATDYPDDALIAYKYAALIAAGGVADPPGTTNTCTFDQNNDGQLDVSKAYARFALMTFDSMTDPNTGLDGTYPSQTIHTADPFLGQWSYLRHSGNPFYATVSDTPTTPSGATCTTLIGQGANGMPGTSPSCCPTFQEVGARNAGAPPWEGRLIPFANPDATLYDLDAQNSLLQQTLLATRPFGATPIDGMMDDARDFLFNDPNGPKADTYKCRDRYIVLLTDGAPNLNLRPSCAATNGVCPYPNEAYTIADQMFHLTDQSKVTTFVIGFSVNGTSPASGADGFPAGLTNNDCKTWFDTAAGTATDDTARAKAMQDACDAQKPPAGTTADACCQLNKIAYYGSGQGAFFAESQADIVLAFGRIMANIIHSASTKTIPAFSPMAAFSTAAFATNAASDGTTKASSAQFIASYIPSSQTPWSGELDRTRSLCSADVPTPQDPDRTKGDFQSENLAKQSSGKTRLFISAMADKSSSAIDSGATLRPYAANDGVSLGNLVGTPVDTSTNNYLATEVVMKDYTLNFNADWPLALNVTNKTCRAGRAVGKGGINKGTVKIPALTDPEQCAEVVWGFATAYPSSQTFAGTYNFNIRCNGASTATGTCSISGASCVPSAPSCKTGETCVPDCAAMGAVYHSSPTVTGAPQSLLREEGFRNFQSKYAKRRTMMYTATTDGLLHAFDAMLQAAPAASAHHELWAFAPPAVLPHLAANYPGGNQILLDGAPVVKEVVWDRTSAQLSDPKKWHTTLVAGLGTVGGYYAMNVTDSDCSDGTGVDDCLTKYESPSRNTRTDIGLPDTSGSEGTPKRGPHFLWQLTDIPAGTSETAKVIRDSQVGSPTKTKMTALFGKNTSTPAVGIVQIKPAADQPEHQVGVAILPGGYDDPPIAKGSCARAAHNSTDDISDSANGAVRANVRQWAKGSCTSTPVPGRNLSIVRLDTGEILRIFGRVQDTPVKLQNLLKGNNGINETLFDSPIVGTPVVYPDAVGVPIQKIFVGDADGTLWRIDVSSTDPKDWKATLFADLIGKATTANADASQPIQVAPVLSTDEAGNIIINAATGDQENIVASDTLENFVYSLRETRDSSHNPKAQILWYKRLTAAERVTGPMTVFDKTLYFASYQPIRPTGTTAGSCDSPGKAWLWGMDYITPKGSIVSANGGTDKWCTAVDTTPTGSGLCTGSITDREQKGQDIIPGVALTASQSCVGSDQLDEYGNSMFSSTSQAQYSLAFGIARPNDKVTNSNKAQAARSSVARPLPRMATQISSWALVLE